MPAVWIPKRLLEIEEINRRAADPSAFIQSCEEAYTQRVAAVAQAVLDAGCHVVMCSGPSASGKTTTAGQLARAIETHGLPAQVVSLDDFYRHPDHYPRKPNGEKDYESIDSLEVNLIRQTLAQLLQQGRASLPRFDFATQTRQDGAYELDMQGGVLVVEGIHALNPRLTAFLQPGTFCRVYAGLREEYAYGGQRVLPSRDVRLVRRLVRDMRFRGQTAAQTLAMWAEVCAGEDLYIKVYKPHADFLLDTAFSYEICCMAPLVQALGQPEGVVGPLADRLAAVQAAYALCQPIAHQLVPPQSMLREFIG